MLNATERFTLYVKYIMSSCLGFCVYTCSFSYKQTELYNLLN